MGIIKKAARGTLAVSTLGLSVAAEKGINAGLAGKTASGEDLAPDEIDAGVIFKGMSHDRGRNAEVTLFRDRIERIKQRSRVSVSSAHQDVEMTPVRSMTSVQTKKDGFYTKVIIYAAGNEVEFRFRHDAAHEFRGALESLMLGDVPSTSAQPAVGTTTPDTPDTTEQIRKLAELRDSGILSEDEFQTKKAELLARM